MSEEHDMTDLAAALRAPALYRLAQLVGGLDGAQRRAQLPGLKALRRELRAAPASRADTWTALLVVGAVCHTAPSGAADWIAQRDFDDIQRWDQPPLLLLLDAQPADWQRDVALRLARRPAERTDWTASTAFAVAEHLLRRSATPPPAEPGFVVEWMRDRGDPRPRRREPKLPPGPDLYARLVRDSFTAVLAPYVFEADTAQQLSGPWAAKDDSQRWPAVLARLAAEQVIDRGELIARALARLLRGGGAGELRSYLAALRTLNPTEDELAVNLRALTALLDGPSTLAGYAQERLIALDRAGRLDGATVVEASEVLLTRPEKKLVRAQLAWLDRFAARAPEAALRAVAQCYGHPDRQLQEQALKVTGRHLATGSRELLTELRAQALLLDPAHAALATRLLGLGVESAEPVAEHDRLPEPFRPAPMPAPLGSPAEVAEELAAALAAQEEDSVGFERILDGLVRFAWADRDALAAALAPVRTGEEWRSLGMLANAVTGALPKQRTWLSLQDPKASPFRTWQLRGGFGGFLAARLEEIAWRLSGDPVPLLLATPTRRDGAIDPAELAARLGRYETLGIEPGPMDLAQALLRTVPDGAPGVADQLGSPAGARLAAWLRAGGLRRQETTPIPAGVARPGVWMTECLRFSDQPGLSADELAMLGVPGAGAPGARWADGVPDAVRTLLGPVEPFHRRSEVEHSMPDGRWLAVLPHHREETAARLIGQFAAAAESAADRGGPQLLPLLAETAGPAGFAVHQALAYGLGAATPEDRTATVDAVLSLAAQGDLDADLLARETGELLRAGALSATRLAATCTELTAAGAPRLTWTLLTGVLPAVLTPHPPAGTAAVLTAAVECARLSGARGPIPAVTAAAASGARSKLAAEAKVLAGLLEE
ncbi:DUF6493 family protein [Kitasatospora sp. NPDC004531]